MKMKLAVGVLALTLAGTASAEVCDLLQDGGLGDTQFNISTVLTTRTDPQGTRTWTNIAGKTYAIQPIYDSSYGALAAVRSVGGRQYNAANVLDNGVPVATIYFGTQNPNTVGDVTCKPKQ